MALKGRRFESGHRLHVPIPAWVRLADSARNCGQVRQEPIMPPTNKAWRGEEARETKGLPW